MTQEQVLVSIRQALPECVVTSEPLNEWWWFYSVSLAEMGLQIEVDFRCCDPYSISKDMTWGPYVVVESFRDLDSCVESVRTAFEAWDDWLDAILGVYGPEPEDDLEWDDEVTEDSGW